MPGENFTKEPKEVIHSWPDNQNQLPSVHLNSTSSALSAGQNQLTCSSVCTVEPERRTTWRFGSGIS
ncbi:hypothetical protein AOLI_G00043680 [Acnodon oligacanthus]